jgi:hypothetical protein
MPNDHQRQRQTDAKKDAAPFCKQQVVSSSLSTGSSTRAGIQPALSFCENVQLLA